MALQRGRGRPLVDSADGLDGAYQGGVTFGAERPGRRRRRGALRRRRQLRADPERRPGATSRSTRRVRRQPGRGLRPGARGRLPDAASRRRSTPAASTARSTPSARRPHHRPGAGRGAERDQLRPRRGDLGPRHQQFAERPRHRAGDHRGQPAHMIQQFQAADIEVLLTGTFGLWPNETFNLPGFELTADPAGNAAAFEAIFPRLAASSASAVQPLPRQHADVPTLNQGDGVHPNAAGVSQIVDRIVPQAMLAAAASGALQAPSEPLLLANGTIEVWFNADDVTARQGLFSKDAAGQGTGGHISAAIQNGLVAVGLEGLTGGAFVQGAVRGGHRHPPRVHLRRRRHAAVHQRRRWSTATASPAGSTSASTGSATSSRWCSAR